jgi:hypothetical protein
MPTNITRRQLFEWSTHGLGSIALLELLQRDGVFAQSGPVDANTNHAPCVKRAIQISLVGGMSHVDSFDYKPALTKNHGKTLGSDEKPDIFFGKVGLLRGSDWEFKQRGQSGLWISEMFPHIAKLADELTLIRSMVSQSANHTPALFASNSGFLANGFPALGSWLSYGLGSETEALPAFVVLPDERGGPNGGASNWTNGYLPGQTQGVIFKGGDQPVRDLFPSKSISRAADQDTRKFIEYLNRNHLDKFGQDEKLLSRIRSYELAARLQTSIPEVSRYADEPAAIRKLYGIDEENTADMGRRCLLGRRLLERGVRFVQVYSGGPIAGNPRSSWDAHENVKDNHSQEAGRIDKPVAALLQDLKQRDMLKDTLVIFTTEFGRTPFAQSAANQVGPGRDHNRYGFSGWLAGGGLRAGTSYGQTDEIGWKAVDDPVTWNDFHATILHLFGIEHEQLTFYHNGIQRRLTNVAGNVMTGILS